MATKSLPISVRITEQDAEFLANLNLQDAVTPSDKIRAILKQARERHERSFDYQGQFRNAQDLISPAIEMIKTHECDQTSYSEVINKVSDWLTETLAFLMSSASAPGGGKINLGSLEKGITERVFRLFESIMRMGITKEAPCYDTSVIHNNISPVLELADIISKQQEES